MLGTLYGGAAEELAATLHQPGQIPPGGGIYDREAYATWMEEAGLTVEAYIPLHDPTGRLRALVGRRPA